jgi:hypothetical protein
MGIVNHTLLTFVKSIYKTFFGVSFRRSRRRILFHNEEASEEASQDLAWKKGYPFFKIRKNHEPLSRLVAFRI